MTEVQYAIQMKEINLYAVATDRGLKGLYFDQQNVPIIQKLEGDSASIRTLYMTVEQLNEYFQGKRKTFDLPLDMKGTEFQKQVWNELMKIPFGETVSYKTVAEKIKNNKAVRAVGTANGRNPICIIVPCHRVISADGSIGGYAGGIDVKKQLLALEMESIKHFS